MVLAITLMIGMVTAVQAEAVLSRDDKAGVLNTLDILRGNGVDYQLDGQLRRSEAAAFIVRLVGMDDEVISNKGKYLQIDFNDVQSHEWFAPYVGYCSQVGIIGGFEDGTFRPNDYVSEQAFLKMLLTAMGYTYKEDFVWATVFTSAYNLKLVSDESYKTRTADNHDYTRGQVVESLFNTLKTKKKSSDTKMVQYFIDNEVIDGSSAEEFGLIVDNVATQIETVEVLTSTSIELTFNEAIEAPGLENIILYNKDDNNNQATISRVDTGGSADTYILILESGVLADRNYGVIVSNVVDVNGNAATDVMADFTGPRPEVVESNYFLISKVESVSNDTINVFFTHPINDNILDPSFITLTKDGQVVSGDDTEEIKLSLISNDSTGMVITFKDYEFTEETTLRLNVSGQAISQYGVTLNDDKGDFINFVPVVRTNDKFEVLLISAESDKTVELWFSRDLNPVIAEQIFSYYITDQDGDPLAIEKAEIMDKAYAVRLTLKYNLVDKREYNIMINNVNDITREHNITEEPHTFTVAKKRTEGYFY